MKDSEWWQLFRDLFEQANGRPAEDNSDLAKWADTPEGEAILLRHNIRRWHGLN
jgi:hypothetical protein